MLGMAGLYVHRILCHTMLMPKRTSRPLKPKATEWAIGQPLNFPDRAELAKRSKRLPRKTVESKRAAER